MTRSIPGFGRVARLLAGVMILGLYGALDTPWKYLTLLGLLPLGSALTGFCPLHAALGRDRSSHTDGATQTGT